MSKYIPRHMEQRIREVSKGWRAFLLTGARQSGKTTMLEKLASEEEVPRRYVSLDDLEKREQARRDPKQFLQNNPPPILIDEIGYAPELFPYIKLLVDQRRQPGDFWLTGSQTFLSMKGVRESLAGRIAILNMPTLSQRELTGRPPMPFFPVYDELTVMCKDFQPETSQDVFQRIWTGSMPGLFGGENIRRDELYSAYLATYLERDVYLFFEPVDALKFYTFVRAAAARTAQLVNYEAIASDADVSPRTARKWMDILEALGIVFLLHPYSNNTLKRTIRKPKMYFYDTGLVTYLTRWSSPEVAAAGAMRGALLENYVVSEIMKGFMNTGRDPFVYYYRDRDNREIDLILEENMTLHPVEIKTTASPDRRLFKSFDVLSKAGLPVGAGAVVCMCDGLGGFSDTEFVVPVGAI